MTAQTIEHLYQQDLTAELGEDYARRACLPTCFYMLGRATGYLKDISFADFNQALAQSESYDPGRGWLRPRLSRELRHRYGMSVASWQFSHLDAMTADDQRQMREAGYFESQREWQWFEQNAYAKPLELILAAGQPVIVTMKPGFGYNQSVHAVIASELRGEALTVIDPDRRNPKSTYDLEQFHRLMSPAGAGSVILPVVT